MTGGRSAPGIPILHSSHHFILVGGHRTADPWSKSYCQDLRRAGEPGPFSPPDGILARNNAEIQCMFWCMFACDITAFYCNILQNRTNRQVFHSVNVMRIRALTCGLLQHSKIWTQNPPTLQSWGFNSPSRHESKCSNSNKLHCFVSVIPLARFLPLEGWCMLGVVTPATSCDLPIR